MNVVHAGLVPEQTRPQPVGTTDGVEAGLSETGHMQHPPGKVVVHAGSSPLVPHRSTLIDGLLCAAAYPHPVGRIELVETHISWVILTGELVYKIKKPVDLGFLDFRDLERRHFFCQEEIRLNRFWAPGIYLDVVPIVMRACRPEVGAAGRPVEYAVRMRQFDQSMRLDHQLETGRLTVDDMLELAGEIAGRHQKARMVPPNGRLLLATRKLIWDNFDDLTGEVSNNVLTALHRWTRETLGLEEARLRDRCEKGFYRECHGDLHLGNIVRLPAGIKAFDCIEFSAELRNIDVVADYAFLVMDLCARGRTDLAYVFLNRYLEISGDYDGVSLLPLYVVYRSLVRAKVAAIRRRERDPGESSEDDRRTIEHYCELARTFTARRPSTLILMTGLSGSGKTWISTRLLAALPAVRLRSDLERKRLFGLGETADSHSGIASGIYSRDAGDMVYQRMLDGAAAMLQAGFDVILDAAFLEGEHRERARQVAAGCGARFAIVMVVASEPVLRRRLRQRTAAGVDASEADRDVLEHQLGKAEALTSVELGSTVTVNTDTEVDVASVVAGIREIAAVPPA